MPRIEHKQGWSTLNVDTKSIYFEIDHPNKDELFINKDGRHKNMSHPILMSVATNLFQDYRVTDLPLE